MGVRALPKIVAQLLARGDAPSTAIALVRWGTTAAQQVVTGTLETIESEVARAGLKPPALIVVGAVVRLREQLQWFDNRPLWNRTIIVTRAREQSSGLVEGLQDLGARVIQCPTIRVENLEDYAASDAAIAALHEFDWVVFTSANAVEKFWQRLRAHRLDVREMSTACLAAIGPATAQALAGHGLIADFVPESSISESVAEGLITCGVAQQHVLIVRALESREVLESKLREGGAFVTAAPCYRTVPDNANAEEARAALAAGEVDWVTFTSSSTVKNFMDAIGADVIQNARASFRVACIGPITARTAEECGLAPDAVAPDASVGSLIEVLGQE